MGKVKPKLDPVPNIVKAIKYVDEQLKQIEKQQVELYMQQYKAGLVSPNALHKQVLQLQYQQQQYYTNGGVVLPPNHVPSNTHWFGEYYDVQYGWDTVRVPIPHKFTAAAFMAQEDIGPNSDWALKFQEKQGLWAKPKGKKDRQFLCFKDSSKIEVTEATAVYVWGHNRPASLFGKLVYVDGMPVQSYDPIPAPKLQPRTPPTREEKLVAAEMIEKAVEILERDGWIKGAMERRRYRHKVTGDYIE